MSRITETIMINHAAEIMKSTDCPIILDIIYGNTAIKAKNQPPNKFKWSDTLVKKSAVSDPGLIPGI
jgi:hypothetical protein